MVLNTESCILPTAGFKAYPQSTSSTRANSCCTVRLSGMVLTANTVRIRSGCLFMCTLLFGLFASNINADALNLKSINSSWKKANLCAAAVNQCAEEHAPDPNTLLKQMASLLPPLLFMPASLWRLNWSAEPGTFSFTHHITHLKKAAWQFSSRQIFPKQLLKKCLMLSRGKKPYNEETTPNPETWIDLKWCRIAQDHLTSSKMKDFLDSTQVLTDIHAVF